MEIPTEVYYQTKSNGLDLRLSKTLVETMKKQFQAGGVAGTTETLREYINGEGEDTVLGYCIDGDAAP